LLHKPLLSNQELPIVCRKSGRFLAELHHAQEHLRSIHADRLRQEEYRDAVVQQYRFMGEFLQQVSDQLARRSDPVRTCFDSDVQVFSNCADWENGDRCTVFMGVRDLQYVILCDGMGRGVGAAQEGKSALQLLRRLLTAGYPGHAAIRCLNSLCALRSRAGAVTVDLLEIELEKGRAKLYKWGAAPSYLMGRMGVERIGVPGPPPGLSVSEQQEQQYRFSFGRGERLVLVSDGVGEENAMHCCSVKADAPTEELAQALLRQGILAGEDDATVVIVTLNEAQ
jgi:stage II sporulation protein E